MKESCSKWNLPCENPGSRRSLDSIGSPIPSVGKTFPCRPMFALKRRQGHTFRAQNHRGRTMFARPRLGWLFLFVGKFLGSLNPFFQKGFKQVRTESATFPVWAKPATLEPRDLIPRPYTVSSRRRRQRPVWRRDWRLDSTIVQRASSLPTTMTRLWARVTAV